MPKKIFIIACEPSGDHHGALLMREIKKKFPDTVFRGLGGPHIKREGAELLHDMTRMSALGFGDVLRQYFTYRRIFYSALAACDAFRPDGIVLIDSPAFNLRFAKKIKKKFPVIYYISPQLWAWGGRRIHTVKKTVSKMLVILPFEKELYDKAGIPCDFVGHPLLDHTAASQPRETLRRQLGIQNGQIAVGIMPGSRAREVERILPLMLETARHLKRRMPEISFFMSRASNVPEKTYRTLLSAYPEITVQTPAMSMQDTVSAMDFAFITSGTATLEATLLGTPFFLFYKTGWSTYMLGKRLIRVPFLGMANLLAGKRIIPEFIQNDIHPVTIAHEAEVLLKNPAVYKKMKDDFSEVVKTLGQKGASARAAESLLQFLKF